MSPEGTLRVLVRAFLRLSLRLYFRSIHVRGRSLVPEAGPVLLVANHPNSLVDPGLLIHLLRRPVHFGARHGLFSTPLRPVLSALGVIPLVRAQDDPKAVRKNLQAIDTYVELLKQRAATAIFPEGVSQDAPHLAPVKSGAARIALKAEAACGFRLGLALIPVGLQFEPRRRFRGDAFVRFGRPIEIRDLAALHRERPREAVGQLTHRIEEALRDLAFHVEAAGRVAFVERLAEVYFKRARMTGLFGAAGRGLRGELLYRTAACLNYFLEVDPASVSEVERALERYDRLRQAAGLDSRLVEEPPHLLPGPLAPIQASLEIALGVVPALFGLITGGIPYCTTRTLARRAASRSRHPPSLSLLHILIGSVAFPLAYGAEAFLAWRSLPFEWAAVFLGALAPSGLFALFYARRVKKLAVHVFGRLASWMHLDHVRRVREAQAELIGLMERLGDRYRHEVFGPEPGLEATRAGSPSRGSS